MFAGCLQPLPRAESAEPGPSHQLVCMCGSVGGNWCRDDKGNRGAPGTAPNFTSSAFLPAHRASARSDGGPPAQASIVTMGCRMHRRPLSPIAEGVSKPCFSYGNDANPGWNCPSQRPPHPPITLLTPIAALGYSCAWLGRRYAIPLRRTLGRSLWTGRNEWARGASRPLTKTDAMV